MPRGFTAARFDDRSIDAYRETSRRRRAISYPQGKQGTHEICVRRCVPVARAVSYCS